MAPSAPRGGNLWWAGASNAILQEASLAWRRRPSKRSDRGRLESDGRKRILPRNIEVQRRARAVQNQKDYRSIGIRKRNVLQASLSKGIRFDAISAWLHKFAGVTHRGEVDCFSYLRRRYGVVNRNHSSAIGATAKIRPVILVQSQIPQIGRANV